MKTIDKIDTYDIFMMVHKCIGNIVPNGESEHDYKTLNNLKDFIDVVDKLIGSIKILSLDAKSEYSSIANIGCYSLSYLAKLRDEITTMLGERWQQ